MSGDFDWGEFWRHAPGLFAVLFIFGGGVLTGVIALIVNGWKSNRESERLAVLKQQMLDKGMSAEEIVRVIQAGKEAE